MRKSMATLCMLATLSLGMLAVTAVPAMAEEDLGQVNYITDVGRYRYQIAVYPSADNCFCFFPNSYVEVDIAPSMAWVLESSRLNVNMKTEKSDGIICTNRHKGLENFNVKFYSPDGKLLGGYDNVTMNYPYSVPSDGKEYDHIVCRIENLTNQNLDARLLIWKSIEPVMAKPIN